jgi:ArsR family transcriptional regulator
MTPVTSLIDTPPCCAPVLVEPLSEAAAEEVAEIFKLLADPTRVQLLSIIAASPGAEACACDLVEPVGKTQPTISHHLNQMVDAGLLAREKKGRFAWFSIRPSAFVALASALSPAACC